MGYLAPGEMFDSMLQLIRFSVYFEGILNTNNGHFHIKIMISAAHMLAGSWACALRKTFEKKAIWCVMMFLCMLYIRATQTSSFACYMRPHSGLSFLAYYIGGLPKMSFFA